MKSIKGVSLVMAGGALAVLRGRCQPGRPGAGGTHRADGAGANPRRADVAGDGAVGVGWHALAGEMRPGTIGGELLEMEQQEVVA